MWRFFAIQLFCQLGLLILLLRNSMSVKKTNNVRLKREIRKELPSAEFRSEAAGVGGKGEGTTGGKRGATWQGRG